MQPNDTAKSDRQYPYAPHQKINKHPPTLSAVGFTLKYDPCLEMSISFSNLFMHSRLSWALGLCLAMTKMLFQLSDPTHSPPASCVAFR